MRARSGGTPTDFTLVVENTLSDSYELSEVLLATANFQGTMHLLTSGRRGPAGAAAAILDRLTARPVNLSLRCRDGAEKSFRLHRRYDRHEDMMYLVAEESAAERRAANA